MIHKLILNNFRNFGKQSFEFGEGINIINAPNASGKTNILEAIFMLSLGKSFKTRKIDECIKYGEQIGRVSTDGLEVVITKDVAGWPKKRLLVNGVPRRLVDFAGNIKTVLFAPQDLELITDGPSLRRNFLDNVLCITDREYRRSLLSYEKGVRQRNRLLMQIRDNGASRSGLYFWNQLLIKNGDIISRSRRNLIEYINNLQKCNLEYDPSSITETRLEQYKTAEVASATTLVGPHRDDFLFLKDGRNIASFGSRGQQRMEVLYLKLAELSYIEEKTNVKPILLLDDIFSELDHRHREIVMEAVVNHQVIITSADPHNLQGLEDKNILNMRFNLKTINL
jgi:DNA replication and repair protein RecF